MRSLWVFCFVWLLCISVEAAVSERREVEHPCFIATNTSKIEIRKIILTDAHTQVDAVMYGNPGEPLVLSSNTFLTAGKASFRLRETDKVSIDGLTEPDVIPESGHRFCREGFQLENLGHPVGRQRTLRISAEFPRESVFRYRYGASDTGTEGR